VIICLSLGARFFFSIDRWGWWVFSEEDNLSFLGGLPIVVGWWWALSGGREKVEGGSGGSKI
jgi:hypothetical protein